MGDRKIFILMISIILGLAVVAYGVIYGMVLTGESVEVVNLLVVSKSVRYNYSVPRDYTYSYFHKPYDSWDDTLYQAAHYWIHYWDDMHSDSTSFDVEYDGTHYGEVNFTLRPVKVDHMFYWGEIELLYKQQRGVLKSIRVELDISEDYEYYLKGWCDDVRATISYPYVNGREYNRTSSPSLVSDDYVRYYTAAKFGANLTAYISFDLLEKDRNSPLINMTIKDIGVTGPTSWTQKPYWNFTLRVYGTVVDGGRVIVFGLQYNVTRSADSAWSLPEPDVEVPQKVTAGELVRLNLTPGQEEVDEYLIFWGDGEVSGTPEHIYAQPGNYSVCVFYRVGKDLSYIAWEEVVVE